MVQIAHTFEATHHIKFVVIENLKGSVQYRGVSCRTCTLWESLSYRDASYSRNIRYGVAYYIDILNVAQT